MCYLGTLDVLQDDNRLLVLEYVILMPKVVCWQNIPIPTPCFLPGVDCLTPASAFPTSPFFTHSHLALLHAGTEASLSLKVAMVVTSKCFCGGLRWVQVPALPLPKCVLCTWDNHASLSAWWWEPHETRYMESCGCAASPHSAPPSPLFLFSIFSHLSQSCVVSPAGIGLLFSSLLVSHLFSSV